jgi:hypothetical protein
MATAKSTDKSTSSGRFVAENGEIDGIPAYGSSSLVTTGHIYHLVIFRTSESVTGLIQGYKF